MPPADQSDMSDDISWLTHAVVDVIDRYARPRERVLMLAPIPGDTAADHLAALKGASESAAQLGRTMELRIVEPIQRASRPHSQTGLCPRSAPGLCRVRTAPKATHIRSLWSTPSS